jgi:hypothetical protein
MKKIVSIFTTIFFMLSVVAQNKSKAIKLSFQNDYQDVFHLSLIIYTPDGKQETRVSDITPSTTKMYEYPIGTEIFITDWKQEAFAMKGNDIKATGVKPFLVLQNNDQNKIIKLSSLSIPENLKPFTKNKPNTNDVIGNWVIDLRPTPESEPYLKDFKFTKVEGKIFDGEFYGYPFSGGFLNTDWEKVYFAFTTSDQSYTYFHSGYIEGNQIFGITLCEGRKFILPWKGMKK